MDYIDLFKNATTFSLLSILISNIYIHKILKKKTTIPIIILILSWITLGLIIKYTSG